MNISTYVRKWEVFAGLVLLFINTFSLQAQCPQAGFTLPDTVCIGESVNIVNTSTGATRYEWDFCSGDFEQQSVSGLVTEIPSIRNFALGITTIKDGQNWYSFITDLGNNSIIRLDYGTDLNSIPTTVNLGNPGGLLTSPDQIKVIKVGNNWFGLVGDLNSNSVNRRTIVRLSFGNSLTNSPQALYVQNLQDKLEIPRSLEVFEDKGNYIAVIANHWSNRLTIINFGNSIANEPVPSNIILTDAVQNVPRSSGLMRISIMKYCNQWIGVAASFNNRLFLYEFGENLFSTPRVTAINNASPFTSFLTSVKLIADQSDITAVVTQYDTKLIRFNFGNSVLNVPSLKTIFNYNATEIAGPDIVTDQSTTFLMAVRYTEKQVVKTVYSACNASQRTSTVSVPPVLSYSQGGMQKITLAAYDAANNISYFTDSVFVRPNLTSSFSSSNQCVNQPVTFTAANVVAGNRAVLYSWNFGDGTTATGRSIQHNFVNATTYNVSLTIKDVCNKTVTTTRAIQISRPSIADFTLPASLCSNQAITFTDASTVIDDPIVKWEWSFGDGRTFTEQNPVYTFTQAGTQTVSLTITGQSGCQTNVVKTLAVQEGANVVFSVTQACLGSQTQFRDESTFGNGTSLTSRSWDFGDDTPAVAIANPLHRYAQPGTYLVKLTIQNSTGCSITRTQSVVIRRRPAVDFTTALACAGESTQFTDGSIAADGTISRWEWSFGDAASGSNNASTAQNALHAFTSPGTYQVKLKVITNFGCADSVSRAVTVIAAPRAEYTFRADCNNKEVLFTDASQPPSGNSITAWYWEFGDNSTPSTERSPRHTYAQSGAYTVRLTVTSASRCTNTIEKTVVAGGIAVSFRPDTAVCASNTIVFDGQATSLNDPVTSWQWDFGPVGKFTTSQPTIAIPATATVLRTSLTVTTRSGCTATLTKNIPVRASATAQFGYQASVSDRLAITFVNQSVNATRYEWNFGDGTQSTETNPVHTFSRPGVFEVTLKAIHANGCVTTSSKKLPLGIANLEGLSVFPNPFIANEAQNVTLGFVLLRRQPVYIELFDVAGRSLQKTTISDAKEDFNAIVLKEVFPGIATLSRGIYLVTFRYENVLQTQKILIQ